MNRDRVRGWQKGLLDAGLAPRPALLVGDSHTIEGGKNAALQALAQTPRPTAMLALGNLIALGAMQALRQADLHVPGDISLITFDEQPWAALLKPALTTVAQPIDDIGDRAMALLFSQLRPGPTIATPERITLPVSLIRRESVSAPPAH